MGSLLFLFFDFALWLMHFNDLNLLIRRTSVPTFRLIINGILQRLLFLRLGNWGFFIFCFYFYFCFKLCLFVDIISFRWSGVFFFYLFWIIWRIFLFFSLFKLRILRWKNVCSLYAGLEKQTVEFSHFIFCLFIFFIAWLQIFCR